MILLAIDCAASLCAASVYDADAGRELGRSVRDLGKGHAEHLMAVIDEALTQAGKTYADLGRIAVTTGPGSFTGVRVGVSAARGFSLALKIPAVGVTTLEALAYEARHAFGPVKVLAALDAGREELHAALYDADGQALCEPAVLSLAEAVEIASSTPLALAGTAARLIANGVGVDKALQLGPLGATADIGTYARLAAGKQPGERPKPLYLRAPDAKPQAGFVLPREEK
ncbi:tRNA (adenosine(37)-N6)-threonylcarbamoyltransferase complex dimerization subunit type 1 TsaB [Aminobacter anthyllidis]|uniref:tRNA (adenosine(37)-N6)-threonylcarbamoyltransferase complex dimerization subunit type 1 TsaB n=1 Tax=Aminobacter anthyllidis TaxID=1035067 RepID=UPI0024581EA6|nr:tRNA (adenosine(37)-N6)-threonylcarbamoyltransferase complex dimerization subunit type 1 TsaB [Aminobacter anthyllidis]MDH4986427.1 tRNA (adenosine(37)-N6)-threonylcarbamoyltransferase complex dimerization subunit type 1 TsaB [Aminobacter anthyllidis]